MTLQPKPKHRDPDWLNTVFRLVAGSHSGVDHAQRRAQGLPPPASAPRLLGDDPTPAGRWAAKPVASPASAVQDEVWVADMIENNKRVDELKTQLRAIMPNMKAENIDGYAFSLHNAMERNEINTPERRAMFLANVAVETGDLRHYRENPRYRRGDPDPAHPGQYRNGLLGTFRNHFNAGNVDRYMDPKTGLSLPTALDRAYAGRMGNGDEASSDGYRYRGGGAIHITGRGMYRTIGKATGLDLENNPDLLLDDWGAALSGAAYWKHRNINQYADAGNFDGAIKAVNGGTNGRDARVAAYQRAQAAFGLTSPQRRAATRRPAP